MTLTTITAPSEQQDAAASPQAAAPRAFGTAQLVQALPGALRKLNPAALVRNPVMLLVWVGAAFTTLLAIAEPFLGGPADSGGTPVPAPFTWGIAVWLWLTVLFANVAESVAEGRGKAQAASLRKTRTSTMARRVVGPSTGSGTQGAGSGTQASWLLSLRTGLLSPSKHPAPRVGLLSLRTGLLSLSKHPAPRRCRRPTCSAVTW